MPKATRKSDKKKALDLGQCPNNTADRVCLSYNCPYKHDRVWPIPPAIQEAMEREIDEEFFYAERVNTPPPIELTPKTRCGFEYYVDRVLNRPSNCPCGCGGQFIPPAKKETDNAKGN